MAKKLFKLSGSEMFAHLASLFLPSKVMKNKRFFRYWESKGYHVTPNHFYEPIPDTNTLKNDIWEKNTELVGIEMRELEQIRLLDEFSMKFKREYDLLPLQKHHDMKPYDYFINNTGFGSVDGEILYCMIRRFKPKRIFEIGSGNSTYLSAKAVLKNKEEEENYQCELVAIEPHPNDTLRAGFPGLSRVIPSKVQDIPLSEFKKLTENDILFIDSSHVLKIGSDVQYEYLEILPRLNKGVIVHLHDIFLPEEYPKEWVLEKFIFWTEQYVLQAFLTFNDRFEVMWAGRYIHVKHPDKLEFSFRSYKQGEGSPGSFWIRKMR